MEMMEKMHSTQLSHVAELNYIRELKKKEEITRELEQRQQLQQLVLLAAFIIIAIIIIAALLLWRKNAQLRERNRSLYEKNLQVMRIETDEQSRRKAYSKSSLNDEQREALVASIQEVLDNPDIICQQDFTLSQLAKMINSNTTYVSQVINESYGMAFSNLLGSQRIRIACRWMEDPARVGSITIEAIASASGFKSRTAFINAFKRETGLKPSEFLRMSAAKKA
jgi:YesN/AraC family two-component response regulator